MKQEIIEKSKNYINSLDYDSNRKERLKLIINLILNQEENGKT